MPHLIAGCPVANRAWALSRWFEFLATQTRRPDGLLFIHSGEIGDETWTAIQREAGRHEFPVVLRHDVSGPHARHDNARFATLARLRNRLLDNATELNADLFLSLDSDVMLENPRTIEHLEQLISSGLCDLAAPVTWLHPAGEESWAYNAGWWCPGGPYGSGQRPWKRLTPEHVPWGELVAIDVPMAAWLGNRRAMDCRYDWHESGEDLGFAQQLERDHIRCLWDTDLRAFHAWDEEALKARYSEELAA